MICIKCKKNLEKSTCYYTWDINLNSIDALFLCKSCAMIEKLKGRQIYKFQTKDEMIKDGFYQLGKSVK